MKHIKHILILLLAIIAINTQAATILLHQRINDKSTTYPHGGKVTLTDSTIVLAFEGHRDTNGNLISIPLKIVTKDTSNPDYVLYGVLDPIDTKRIYHMNITDNTISIYGEGELYNSIVIIISGFTDNTTPANIHPITTVDESNAQYVPTWVWITIGVLGALVGVMIGGVIIYSKR